MVSKDELKIGDIIKREITSRQSWTVDYDMYGDLVGKPNTNKFFKDTTPIELEGRFIKIAEIKSINWNRRLK